LIDLMLFVNERDRRRREIVMIFETNRDGRFHEEKLISLTKSCSMKFFI